MRRIITLVASIAFLSAFSPAVRAQNLVPRGSEQPSFDCAQAKAATARLICADGELARLDGELGVAFQKRKSQLAASDQTKFVAGELVWIRDRNQRCGLVGTMDATIEELAASKPCLVSAIRERIAFLDHPGSLQAGAPVIDCDHPQNPGEAAVCRQVSSNRAPPPPPGYYPPPGYGLPPGYATSASPPTYSDGAASDGAAPPPSYQGPTGYATQQDLSACDAQPQYIREECYHHVEADAKANAEETQSRAAEEQRTALERKKQDFATAPSPAQFDVNLGTALLDKRDTAMSALDEIATTMGDVDSQQLISALNVLVSPDAGVASEADSKLYLSLGNCAASAVKRGSRSAVKMLQNDCAREYLAWFPTCVQTAKTAKACSVMALLMTRVAVEGYQKYCVDGTAEDAARFGCTSEFSTLNPQTIVLDPESINAKHDNTNQMAGSLETGDSNGQDILPKVIGWSIVGCFIAAFFTMIARKAMQRRPASGVVADKAIQSESPKVGNFSGRLKPCRECGVAISPEAKTCPHCGVDSPVKNVARETISALFGLGILFGIGYLLFGPQTPQPTLASLPVNSSDFATVVNDTGCKSPYSEERKEELFNSDYRDHRMQVSGQIVTLNNGSASLKVLPTSILQDIVIEFADKDAGYNLTNGSWITVSFRMTREGGCFLPYSGDLGKVIPN